jgi:TonB family protein
MVPWLLSYLFNALWQTPLIFAAAWLAARLVRRAGPRVEHRVWVGALLLQIALPAGNLRIAAVRIPELWRALLGLFLPASAANAGSVHVVFGPASATAGTLHLPFPLELGVVLAYACLVHYFAARLAWGLIQTRTLARAANPITLAGEAAQAWLHHCRRLGITPPPPEIAASPEGIGPVTVGLRRGLLLVPPAFLESLAPADRDAVLAHELAHIARHDFAKNLLYGLVSLPVAWHPLVWRSRARIAESRELVCDAIAADAIAGGAVAGRRHYAQSLLRLAAMLAGQPASQSAGQSKIATLHALGILSFNQDANALERRVMSLTHKRIPLSTGRRILIAAACSVLALATCTSALALHTAISAPAQAASASHRPKKISVSPEVMTGNRISGENPTYPDEARAKKIEGKVVLDVTIGKDGTIEKVNLLKSPDKLLSGSAIKAVRTWRYRPYLLNGEPIAVETTINVIFCTHNCPSFPGPTKRVG